MSDEDFLAECESRMKEPQSEWSGDDLARLSEMAGRPQMQVDIFKKTATMSIYDDAPFIRNMICEARAKHGQLYT